MVWRGREEEVNEDRKKNKGATGKERREERNRSARMEERKLGEGEGRKE